jgi:hypothetical protein
MEFPKTKEIHEKPMQKNINFASKQGK